MLEAVQLLDRALARDPSFFLAQCQLAYTHDQLYFIGGDHIPRLALAEAAVQRFGYDPMLEKRTWLAPKIFIAAISIMVELSLSSRSLDEPTK